MKDPMLEKLVLLIVSMFSIATELRLENKLANLSEPWHAQSVICASYYLPKQCPLVDHLIESYFKHYPKNPIEEETKNLVIP
jgi:hypothetical protein